MATGGLIRNPSFTEKVENSPPLKRFKSSEGFPTLEDIFDDTSTSPTLDGHIFPMERKIFNDSIHGPIQLHPLLVSIIDTPQFQRLRDIKQLGASYWVYPGASHNRFEHCIGTSYLCGLMLKILRDYHRQELRQEEPFGISDNDILCVEIAGLCHDLGHGPFSHTFDMKYLEYVKAETPWTHEEGSCDMFDDMVEQNPNLRKKFEDHGIFAEQRDMIKDIIRGKDPEKDKIAQACDFNGKCFKKWFLYEIVSNKRNGIDCDKFDYFMRDCHYVGVSSNFDCQRYFRNIKIIPVDGQLQICVRDKEIFNLYELFHTRWSLHHRVYQHKTTRIIEQMMVEAIANVDKDFQVSSSVKDPSKFVNLSDSIIYQILRSSSIKPEFVRSRELLQRIQRRDLYRFCGQINPLSTPKVDNIPSQEVLNKENISEAIVSKSEELCESDVFVDVVKISFGMGKKNPINSVLFFGKDGKPYPIKQHHVSELLPKKFQEQYIRVYARHSEKRDIVWESFRQWCEDSGYEIPCVLQGDVSGYYTNLHKDEAQHNLLAEERQKSVLESDSAKRSLADFLTD